MDPGREFHNCGEPGYTKLRFPQNKVWSLESLIMRRPQSADLSFRSGISKFSRSVRCLGANPFKAFNVRNRYWCAACLTVNVQKIPHRYFLHGVGHACPGLAMSVCSNFTCLGRKSTTVVSCPPRPRQAGAAYSLRYVGRTAKLGSVTNGLLHGNGMNCRAEM